MRKAIGTLRGDAKDIVSGRCVFAEYIIVLLALFVLYNYFPGPMLAAICA